MRQARDFFGFLPTALVCAGIVETLNVHAAVQGPTQGLVAYWKFDEGAGATAADSSGNGYTLSLVNGPTWTAGKLNGGLSFNGLNEYGVVPGVDLSGTAAASVSVWLNRVWTPLTSGATVLLEFSANFNSSTTGFMFFPDDQCGGMVLGLHGNNGYNINCYNQPSSGAWHHLVLIYDKSQNAAGEVSLYLDGVLQAPRSRLYAADNSNAFGANPLYLFSRGGNQLFASGTIDELRIYNRALSAAEVGQLYGLGSAVDTTPPTVAMTAPSSGAIVSGTIPVSANASDDVAVVGVQFQLDGSDLGAEVTSSPYQVLWSTAGTTDGPHTLSATARDAAGNTSVASISVTVSNTLSVPGPVAYWKFDEGAGATAADSSGNGYTLSLVNGPTWTAGKLNGGLSFNGLNEYGVVPGIDLSGTAAASVSVWLNRVWTPLTSGATVLLEFSANFNSSTTGFTIFPDDQCGGMALGLQGNNGYNINCYNQPSSGAWHHLVFIYDKSQNAAGEVSLYLDGVLQAPRSRLYGADNSNLFGANPLYLFSRGGNQLFASGTIDELRIYNRALSAAEVGQLYGLGSNSAPVQPAGLMARVNATNATEWVANGSPTVTIANNAIVYSGDAGASCIGYINILGKRNNRWSMRQSGIGWVHTVPTIAASSYGIALGIVPDNYENFNRSLMGQFDMTTTSIGRVHIAWGGQWGSSPTDSPLSAPILPTPQTGDLITNYFCLSNNTSIMWSSNLTRGGSTSVAVDISLGGTDSTLPLDPTVGVPAIKNWCNSPVTISNIGIFSVIPKPQQYALFGASICFGYNGGAWTNTFEANITRLLSSEAQGGACRFIGTSGCMEADLTNLFWEASARGVKHVIFKDVGNNAYASWGIGASATTSNIWWAFQAATNLFGPANVVMGTPFPRLNADLTPIYNWVIRTFSGGLAANLGPDDFMLLKDPGDPYLQSQYANDPGGLGHFSPLGFRVCSTNTAIFLNSRYGLQ
jgi:hypothetical protein